MCGGVHYGEVEGVVSVAREVVLQQRWFMCDGHSV